MVCGLGLTTNAWSQQASSPNAQRQSTDEVVTKYRLYLRGASQQTLGYFDDADQAADYGNKWAEEHPNDNRLYDIEGPIKIRKSTSPRLKHGRRPPEQNLNSRTAMGGRLSETGELATEAKDDSVQKPANELKSSLADAYSKAVLARQQLLASKGTVSREKFDSANREIKEYNDKLAKSKQTKDGVDLSVWLPVKEVREDELKGRLAQQANSEKPKDNFRASDLTGSWSIGGTDTRIFEADGRFKTVHRDFGTTFIGRWTLDSKTGQFVVDYHSASSPLQKYRIEGHVAPQETGIYIDRDGAIQAGHWPANTGLARYRFTKQGK